MESRRRGGRTHGVASLRGGALILLACSAPPFISASWKEKKPRGKEREESTSSCAKWWGLRRVVPHHCRRFAARRFVREI